MFEGMTAEEIYGLVAFYLLLCGIVALIASGRGKSSGGAFALSLLLSPLIGFLIVVLGRAENQRDCPHCGESIKRQAKVCRYCGRDVTPAAR